MASDLYSKHDLLAGRLIDDTAAIRSYQAQILKKIQNLYLKRKIDHYEYSHFVNILTVMNLKVEDMKGKLNSFIDRDVRHSSINIKI